MKLFLSTTLIACILVSSANAYIIIDDGDYHLIDYELSDSLKVRGVGTHVEFVDGAITPSGKATFAMEYGRITMSGGHLGWSLGAYDNSVVSVSGGHISGQLLTYSSQPAEMSGGTVGFSALVTDDGHLNFSGGTINRALSVSRSGSATVTGGVIDGNLYLYHFAQAMVSGGIIKDDIILGTHNERISDCFVTLDGSNFAVNDQTVSFGELATRYALEGHDGITGKLYYYGTVTGNLANGDILNNDFIIYDDSNITFIPEPTTLLLLGLGGLALRKCRQV